LVVVERLARWAAVESVLLTVRRYRRLEIEYAALRVVGRGLFLAVMLMVAFLYVLTRVTDVLAGANEVLIPTTTVNPDVDLGELARGAFTRMSTSVIGVLGTVTFVVSALFSAQALRGGGRRALHGDSAQRAKLLSWQTLGVAVILALVVLASWVLTLATAIRYRAWVTALGRDLGTGVVDGAKAGAILLSLLLIGGCVLVAIRVTVGALTTRSVVASTLVAVVVVGANFFLLYTYVGALINPAVSAGIVLILTLLLWVNVVVRAYLGALCWVAVPSDAPDPTRSG